MRVLVAGWFSFEQMGASAGDLLVRDLACTWLESAGRNFDVALAPPFEGGVDWRTVDPSTYTDLVFVCGPFGNGPPLVDLLARFERQRLLGLNLTMLDSLENWNPFHLLLERDSSRTNRPDLALAAEAATVPVIGLIFIDAQPEYRNRDLHEEANAKLEQIAAELECARVRIDTRLDENSTELRTANEVVSLVARTDVVLTTRLHGMVLALRAGVPAIAVDSVAGGAKITRQAQALGWPWCFPAQVELPQLRDALRECLTDEARREAASLAARAEAALAEARDAFTAYISPDPASTSSPSS